MVKNNEDKYDLIFMDIDMPIMDGYETVEEMNRVVKNEVKYESKITIIACTGYNGDEIVEKF